MSGFQTVARIALLSLLVSPLTLASSESSKAAISLTIDPLEATVHVGQKQKFAAIVKGHR